MLTAVVLAGILRAFAPSVHVLHAAGLHFFLEARQSGTVYIPLLSSRRLTEGPVSNSKTY